MAAGADHLGEDEAGLPQDGPEVAVGERPLIFGAPPRDPLQEKKAQAHGSALLGGARNPRLHIRPA